MRTYIPVLAGLVVLAAVGPALAPGASAVSTGQDTTQSDCTFPVTRTDTTGTEVTLDAEPESVVVLQPSDAQVAWELGIEDRVVGMPRTRYTSYLSGREGKTNVKGEDGGVVVEQVVGLQPDLVLAANATRTETVRSLREAGLTVYHFGNVRTLDEIGRNVETVGALTGECVAAERSATDFRERVRTVERAAEMADGRPSVLYYFFEFTTGNGTHIHDVLETAGGDNVAADAGVKGYRQLNPEVVVDRDPAWLVYPSDATLPTSAAYENTTALREDQTVELDSNDISQPGPRVVKPLTRLARTWHPDALDRANESVGTDSPTATATAGDGGETATPTASTPTSTSGPGFGVVGAGAALALLALAVLVGRRR